MGRPVQASRVEIVEFGASNAVLTSLVSSASGVAASVTVFAVGYEAKVYTHEGATGQNGDRQHRAVVEHRTMAAGQTVPGCGFAHGRSRSHVEIGVVPTFRPPTLHLPAGAAAAT
ncbi:hypothetical protein DM02DRAFT_657791 [Periconia macrospinosa]|uniref:Uncharacterized protein n=1 Tax=Periconia macrospinosa TaxID=97972 RepID=A0A2V1DJ62_9PLEO|nr:hypothetical protein DM02DRAFT_657791 [Periconia macrospinosa]